MGAIQPWHLVILLIIVLLVFGPGKLPDVGKAVGQTIREFREASKPTDGASAESAGGDGAPGSGPDRQPPAA